MEFRSKNLLITGGSGFIGSNFINYFLKNYSGTSVYNLDALTYASDNKNLDFAKNNKNYNFIKGDICNYELLNDIFLEFNIDGVINFAAESHVDNSILNPNIFLETNTLGVLNLLNIAKKKWMIKPNIPRKGFEHARFHQISTDEVYGSILKGCFTEDSKYYPNSPYSASKASADMLVRAFNKTYGLDTVITISSNNFGPNQNNEKFIPKLIDFLLSNQEFPLYGDGKNIRDWMYVIDHCKAIALVFNNSKFSRVYNICANNELSNIEIIELIIKIISKKTDVSVSSLKKLIKFVEDRPGHDRRYSVDCSRIVKEFKWKISYNFNNEIKSLIEKKILSKKN